MAASEPSPELSLYYAPRTRSFGALWMLEELGESYRLESFDIQTGRHKQPDYLALNPMGKVPLVVHGGLPVSELGAIAIYLADAYPGGSLGPSPDDPLRPAFLRWIFFSSAIMEPAFGQQLLKWEIPAVSASWGSFDQMLAVLTEAVSDHDWLLGGDFSAADVLVGATLRFGQVVGIIPNDGAVGEYVQRLQSREAFQRAAEIEAKEVERLGLEG